MPGEIKSSVTAFRQAVVLSGRTSVLRVCCVSECEVKCAMVVKTCWKEGGGGSGGGEGEDGF